MNFFKKHFGSFLILLAVGVVIFWPEVSWGAGPAGSGGGGGSADSTAKSFSQIMSFLVSLVTSVSIFFLDYLGVLLDSKYLIGDGVNGGIDVMTPIRDMWVVVRNIVNVVFVLILMFLAFSNLYSSLAGEGGNWTIKDKLPKILISLVAINFSLLGFRLAIDAVNVATTGILAIGDSAMKHHFGNENIKVETILGKGIDDKGKLCNLGGTNPPSDCYPFYTRANSSVCTAWKDEYSKKKNLPGDRAKIQDLLRQDKFKKCSFLLTSGSEIKNPSTPTARNLILSMTVFFQHLEVLPQLTAKFEKSSSWQTWLGIVDNTLFSALLGLMFSIVLVALGVVLIVRMVVIWMAMIFSPVIVSAGIMGFNMGDAIGKLVTNLIVPIKIAAIFSVTFVLFSSMIGSVDIISQNSFVVFGTPLSKFGESPTRILWQVATIVIFWKAAFWALDGTFADSAVNFIKTSAEKVGNYAVDMGMERASIPFLKVNGQPISFGALLKIPDALQASLAAEKAESRDEASQLLGLEKLQKISKARKEMTKFAGEVERSGAKLSEFFDKLEKLGLSSLDATQTSVINMIKKLKPKVNDAQLNKLKEANNETSMKKALKGIFGDKSANRIDQMKWAGKADAKGGGGGGVSVNEKTIKNVEVAVLNIDGDERHISTKTTWEEAKEHFEGLGINVAEKLKSANDIDIRQLATKAKIEIKNNQGFIPKDELIKELMKKQNNPTSTSEA